METFLTNVYFDTLLEVTEAENFHVTHLLIFISRVFFFSSIVYVYVFKFSSWFPNIQNAKLIEINKARLF